MSRISTILQEKLPSGLDYDYPSALRQLMTLFNVANVFPEDVEIRRSSSGRGLHWVLPTRNNIYFNYVFASCPGQIYYAEIRGDVVLFTMTRIPPNGKWRYVETVSPETILSTAFSTRVPRSHYIIHQRLREQYKDWRQWRKRHKRNRCTRGG